MARPVKVYGAMVYVSPGPLHDALVERGQGAHMVQARGVVATTTVKAAREALGITRGEWTHSGCETGNPIEIAVASARPGTVFVSPINASRTPDAYVAADLNIWGRLTPAPEEA